MTSFPNQLRPLVENAGGSTKAAAILHITPQIINAWLRGVSQPNLPTQAGALFLLGCPSHELPQSTLSLPGLSDAAQSAISQMASIDPTGFIDKKKLAARVQSIRLTSPTFPAGDLAAARAGRGIISGGLLKAKKGSA